MFWKDHLALEWRPLGGAESQQPHGMMENGGIRHRQPCTRPPAFSCMGLLHGIQKSRNCWMSPARPLPQHIDGGGEGQRGERTCPVLGIGASVPEAQAVPHSRGCPALEAWLIAGLGTRHRATIKPSGWLDRKHLQTA